MTRGRHRNETMWGSGGELKHAKQSMAPRSPAPITTAASGVAIATLVLAIAAFVGLWLDVAPPLVAQGALVVAIGGAILGVTLAAVALLVTRHRRDPTGRRRAWLGAGVSLALLAALILGFGHGLESTVVVGPDGGPPAATRHP